MPIIDSAAVRNAEGKTIVRFKIKMMKSSIKRSPAVIVVSGLPRSGTSMAMKMLAAGGVELAADHQRRPDVDNPEGYFELEKVKQLRRDSRWVATLGGKALKVVSMLLYHLPPEMDYRVIFMNRLMAEILASQKKMLERSGNGGGGKEDDIMAAKFRDHLAKIERWVSNQPNFDVLQVRYSDAISRPRRLAENLAAFLALPLDIDAMAAVVDPELYRNRGAQCQ